MIGDTRNRCDLVYAEIGIFDSQVYFVLEVNSTPDTFHKVYNDEQEYGAGISPLVCNEGNEPMQRCFDLLPSLQTNREIPAPTTCTTILLLIIMNFVESIRGRIHLYHEIYMKIENTCFCRNQVTPVWRITNQQ